MSWSYNSVIGYNAAGRVFRNHPLSGRGANRIACANAPASNWTNVLYDLTTVSLNISAPPTVEPCKHFGHRKSSLFFFLSTEEKFSRIIARKL